MTELGKFVNTTNWEADADEEIVLGEERAFSDREFVQTPQKAVFHIASVQWDAEPSKYDPNWKNVRVYWERGENGPIFTEYLFVPLTRTLAFGEKKSPREWSKVRSFLSMFGLLDRLADNATALKVYRELFRPNDKGECEQLEGRAAVLELGYGDRGVHVEDIPGLGYTACNPDGTPTVFKSIKMFDPAVNADVEVKDSTISAPDFAGIKQKLGQAKVKINRLRIQSAKPVSDAQLTKSAVAPVAAHLDPHQLTEGLSDVPDFPL